MDNAMRKKLFPKLLFYLSPLLIVFFYSLEFLYFWEQIILSALVFCYPVIQFEWFSGPLWRKVIDGLFFGVSLLLISLSLLLSLGNIFGGGVKDRYFYWNDCTLYYIMEDPHFYEETTLRLKSVNWSGTKKINDSFYQNGYEEISITKEYIEAFYNTEEK